MGKTDNEEDYDSEKDFETLKKNLNLLNSYALNQINNNRNKTIKNQKYDETFVQKSNKILKYVNDKNKKTSKFNWINIFGTILLLIGIVILTWDSVRIHFVYLARLLIVLVIYIIFLLVCFFLIQNFNN
jgi:hypothetical protein